MPDGGAPPRNGTRNGGTRKVKAPGAGAVGREQTKRRSPRAKGEARPPQGNKESWAAALTRQTQQHPGRTVALAVGAGFVLGGGLFSRLSMRVAGAGLRLAVRAAMVPAIRQGVVALAQDLLKTGADTPASEGPAEPAPTGV